jgi:pimeloyl-ACP methyl ester carboxylesterase
MPLACRIAMRRTAGEIVEDLHRVLIAADVPGPDVLAGHCCGGLVMRRFASIYPDEGAGIVLIDAAHEDDYAGQQRVMTPEQWNELARLAAEGPSALAGYPDVERLDTTASADQVRLAVALTPLREIPEIVLTHGRPWECPAGSPLQRRSGRTGTT